VGLHHIELIFTSFVLFVPFFKLMNQVPLAVGAMLALKDSLLSIDCQPYTAFIGAINGDDDDGT
jgi:hypothetical protein